MNNIDIASLSSALREEYAVRLDAIESIDDIYKTYVPKTVELEQSAASTTTLKDENIYNSQEDGTEIEKVKEYADGERGKQDDEVKAEKTEDDASKSENAEISEDDSSRSEDVDKTEDESSILENLTETPSGSLVEKKT